MKLLVKDSGLNTLKASVQYCGECEKPQIHYAAEHGWAVCHVCGYSAGLDQLIEDELPSAAHQPQPWLGSRAA
jgi:hypothetical protein